MLGFLHRGSLRAQRYHGIISMVLLLSEPWPASSNQCSSATSSRHHGCLLDARRYHGHVATLFLHYVHHHLAHRYSGCQPLCFPIAVLNRLQDTWVGNHGVPSSFALPWDSMHIGCVHDGLQIAQGLVEFIGILFSRVHGFLFACWFPSTSTPLSHGSLTPTHDHHKANKLLKPPTS